MVPFLGTLNIRCRITIGVQKGTIILTTTHIKGIMEKKTETTIVHWGYIGIMEKKMETTLVY